VSWIGRSTAALAVVLLSAVLAGPAGATTNTTIGFDDLVGGTVVTNQYGSDGVTFGTAAGTGVTPGTSDCGPPTVRSDASFAQSYAHSPPNVASAPHCGNGEFSNVGTFAAFAYPRKSVSAYVGTVVGATGLKAIMIGFDSSGVFVAYTPQTPIGQGANTLLSISSTSANIAYLEIYLESQVAAGIPLLIDDLSFDNSASPLSVAANTLGAVAGTSFSGTVANIADGDPTATAADYSSSITWGDGQTSTGSVSAAAGGGFDVSGTNTYAAVGSYPVTVTVNKVDGRTVTGHGTANVSATAGSPTIGVTQTHSPTVFVHGQTGSFHVALHNGSSAGTAAISLTDNFGASFAAPVSIANQIGISCPTPVSTGATVTCTISGGLAGGASASFDISGTVSAAPGSTAHNIVSASDVGGGGTTTASGALDAIAITTIGVGSPPHVPHAAFTSTATATAVTLDGSGTHAPGAIGVVDYTWNVSGANTSSNTCGGGTSDIKLFLPNRGTDTVTLTVRDSSGGVTQTQHTVESPGLGYQPKHHSPLVNDKAVIGFCIPGLNDPPVDVSQNGGPPPGCNKTLQVGLTEAVGCFTEITKGKDVPAAEAAILNQTPEWTSTAGLNPDFAGTGASAARFNPVDVGLITNEFYLGYFATPFVSNTTVRINGVDYIPHNGATILVVPRLSLIISSDATVAVKNIPVGNGQVVEKVPFHNIGDRVHIDDYQLSREADRIGVAGLPFDGRMSLDFTYHRAELTAQLTLPNFFSTDGGDPFNATVVLHTDNHTGLELDQIHLGPLNADIVGLGFKDVRFDYDAQTGNWDAQGMLDLFGAVAIDAAPPPDEYGVHFRGGEFKSAGAAADFGDAGITIFPGITLNRIGVGFGVNPTLFIGDIGIRVVDLAQIDGRVIVAFPSDAAPYTLTTGDAGPQFAPIAGHTFTNSPTLGVGGALSLHVPGLGTNIQLANAYFLYSYPSYIAVGGGFHFGVDSFNLDGGVNGEFNVARGQFNVEGHVDINLPDPLPGFGGAAVVSSKGIAACGRGYVFPYGHIELGAGYHWGGGVVIWLGNCNLGEFHQDVQTASVHAATAPRVFTLPPGLPSAEVRVLGVTDAPIVTLHGGHSRRVIIVRTRSLKTTWIGIDHPAGGTYTIVEQPGSPTIASVATASGLAPPSISARVTGSETSRVLRYRVRRRPGQVVTFLEGSHAIGSTTGGNGALRFVPLGGPMGFRAIVAQVTLNGNPNANLKVARFRVARLATLRRVQGLRVKRRGLALRISWRGVAGAERYAIDVHGTDGRVRSVTVSSARRTLLVRGVARSVSGRVTVTALRRRDHSPHTVATFRATARLRTGIHPAHRR
jgi:hypothetical protein